MAAVASRRFSKTSEVFIFCGEDGSGGPTDEYPLRGISIFSSSSSSSSLSSLSVAGVGELITMLSLRGGVPGDDEDEVDDDDDEDDEDEDVDDEDEGDRSIDWVVGDGSEDERGETGQIVSVCRSEVTTVTVVARLASASLASVRAMHWGISKMALIIDDDDDDDGDDEALTNDGRASNNAIFGGRLVFHSYPFFSDDYFPIVPLFCLAVWRNGV